MSAEPVIVVYSHIVGLAIIRAQAGWEYPLSSFIICRSKWAMSRSTSIGAIGSRLPKRMKKFSSPIPGPGRSISRGPARPYRRLHGRCHVQEQGSSGENFPGPVQDWSIVSRVVRKQYTYELAEQVGVPCPGTLLCDNLEDIEKRIPDFPFPFLLKPCEGHRFFDIFLKKVLVIRNISELRACYRELQDFKIPMMVQEIIPGEACEGGVNYNSYIAGGEPIAEFTSEKVRLDPPFSASWVIVSKKIPQIIEPGRKLLKALGYQGFSCMEFKRDVRDGVYKLMEINARHNLSGSLVVACGINFPWIMYSDLVNGRREYRSDFRENVYWIDLTEDVMRFFVSRKAEGYSIAQYLAPYRQERLYAILDIRDPFPFVKRGFDILRKACSALYMRVIHKRSIKSSSPGVVVLGGDFQALGAIRSLAVHDVRVFLVDDEPNIARFSRYLSGRLRIPALCDPHHFAERLIELAKSESLDGWMLLPNNDELVMLLAKNREILSEYFSVPVPPWTIVRKYYYKDEAYELAQKILIPIPRKYAGRTAKEILDQNPVFPLVLKPRAKERYYPKAKKGNPRELR